MSQTSDVVDKKSEVNKGKIEISYKFILKLLDTIKIIAIKKMNNQFEDIIAEKKTLKEIIEPRKPYILGYDDFDNENFYHYICQVSVYFLLHFEPSTHIKKVVLKNIIDISSILKIILENKNNYNQPEIKFYLFHLINVFALDSKIEKSSKFFKIGVNTLIKKYGIIDYEEFFPENEKEKIKNDFFELLDKLLFKIKEEFLAITKNEKNEKNSEKYYEKIEEISKLQSEINKEKEKKLNIKNIKDFIANIITINASLINKKYFYILSNMIFSLYTFFPEEEKDFQYCLNYIEIKKDFKDMTEENFKDYLLNGELIKNYFADTFIKDFLDYIIKFKKISKIIKISNGEDTYEKEFKEIISNKVFQKKIRDFYLSNKMIKFINTCVDKDERENIKNKLSELNKMLAKDEFWEKIYFFTLTKYKKAFVSNYLRIIVNNSFIKLIIRNENEKYEILNLLLFELLVHEIFHLLRRLAHIGEDSMLSLTPPDENDKKENLLTGEIGVRLIGFFFKVDKIQKIILEQAQYFSKLDLEKETDIEKLSEIFEIKSSKKESETSFAKFNETEKEKEIIFEIHDCRKFIYIPPFKY